MQLRNFEFPPLFWILIITITIRLSFSYDYYGCNPSQCPSKCCDQIKHNGDSKGCYTSENPQALCWAMEECNNSICPSKCCNGRYECADDCGNSGNSVIWIIVIVLICVLVFILIIYFVRRYSIAKKEDNLMQEKLDRSILQSGTRDYDGGMSNNQREYTISSQETSNEIQYVKPLGSQPNISPSRSPNIPQYNNQSPERLRNYGQDYGQNQQNAPVYYQNNSYLYHSNTANIGKPIIYANQKPTTIYQYPNDALKPSQSRYYDSGASQEIPNIYYHSHSQGISSGIQNSVNQSNNRANAVNGNLNRMKNTNYYGGIDDKNVHPYSQNSHNNQFLSNQQIEMKYIEHHKIVSTKSSPGYYERSSEQSQPRRADIYSSEQSSQDSHYQRPLTSQIPPESQRSEIITPRFSDTDKSSDSKSNLQSIFT